MNAPVNRVTLNGKAGPPATAAGWIQALNDPRIIREKSGFLFKAGFDGDHLMLEAAPTLINGERSYHYNMRLQKEDAFTLIGAVTAEGVFNILFKPENYAAVVEHAAEYIQVFRRFAAFLLAAGYIGEGRLNEVARSVLAELGLNPAPETLAELGATVEP